MINARHEEMKKRYAQGAQCTMRVRKESCRDFFGEAEIFKLY